MIDIQTTGVINLESKDLYIITKANNIVCIGTYDNDHKLSVGINLTKDELNELIKTLQEFV